jgi:hypothetical protein
VSRQRVGRQRGQVIVIFGLGLLVILLTVGLVVDGGTAFLERRAGQNSADLGAMAGTKIVADAYVRSTFATRGGVQAAIAASMADNGCGTGGAVPCTWKARFMGSGQADLGPVVAGDGGAIAGSGIIGVRVDVDRRPRTYFLGLIGQSSWRVDTTATALTIKPAVAPAGQLLPIAIRRDPNAPFQAGQVYDVARDKVAPTGFAWLSWSGSKDPNRLHASLCTPDNPTVSIGASMRRGPIAASPADISCFARWIQSRATVLIPTYTKETMSGYQIDGVAAFIITSTGLPTHQDFRAYFVGTYPYPTLPGSGGESPPSKTDSLYYLGLVR